MTDDLVQRLRRTYRKEYAATGSMFADNSNRLCPFPILATEVLFNPDGAAAADRIEALQAEVTRLKDKLSVETEPSPYCPICGSCGEEGCCGSKRCMYPAAEWQAGYGAGVEAAAKALEDDAMKCDCFAFEEDECACGAWNDYKDITSARAVEIVRSLQEQSK